ncbi:MAG: hypothetical protein WA437_03290, partial [Candidatus Sulfotelmatobacter sp.]
MPVSRLQPEQFQDGEIRPKRFGYPQVRGCAVPIQALSGAGKRTCRTGNPAEDNESKQIHNPKSGELNMADLQQLEESIVALSLLDAA